MSHSYDYPRPAVTVDAIVLTLVERRPSLLLIRRGHEPFVGQWALPGGFVDEHEDLEPAMRRELLEETGLVVGPSLQVGAYGTPGRDPRGHTVGVAFLSALRVEEIDDRLSAGDDAAEAALHPLDDLPAIAFDHADMIRDALLMLQASERTAVMLSQTLGHDGLEAVTAVSPLDLQD